MAKLWSLKGKKILIVDDFPAMRSMMRNMLISYGADTIAEARDGDEAIRHLEKQKKEIVLCDYNLGDASRDGQQILEEARQRGLLPYSSIFIVTTAENTATMVMGAVEHMPDNYLVKPYTRVVLQARLRKLMDKKEGLKAVSKAVEAKNYPRAIALCDEAMDKDKKLVFEMMKLKGDLLLKVADYSSAATLYNKVLEIRQIAWALFGLGKTFYYQDDFEAARDLFASVIEENKAFVAAYDWLAKVENKMGNSVKAQETLQKAVDISPRGLLRQRSLAEVSMENEDFDVSEKAWKSAVKVGKNSAYKSPEDYGGLARIHIKKKAGDAAVKAIEGMKKEYRNSNAQAMLESAVIESVINKDLDRNDVSISALERAMALFYENPGALTSESAMVLAESSFALGEKDKGSELVQHMIRNNHEDSAMIDGARRMLGNAGLDADVLIDDTCKEVISVNNDGVGLAKEGKLEESISLFEKAVQAMPENIVINLNAAQSLIMLMQKNGVNNSLAKQAQVYLEAVGKVDLSNERYKNLLTRFHDLGNESNV